MTTEEKLTLVLQALEERKAQDVVVLDVSDRTQMTDRLVIASGTSNIHIRALIDRVLELMKEHGVKGVRREGYSEARWVLIDFGDVVVHVFDPEDRAFYRLQEFWTRTPKPPETQPGAADETALDEEPDTDDDLDEPETAPRP